MQNKEEIISELSKIAQSHFLNFNSTENDSQYFQSLYDDFSEDLNVVAQLKLFHAWCLDQHPQRITNTRLRIRSWMQNAVINKNSRTPNGNIYKRKKPQD